MNHFLRVPTQVPTRHVQPIPEFSPVLVLRSHVGHQMDVSKTSVESLLWEYVWKHQKYPKMINS